MAVDGLGSDAARQTLTAVGAGGVRARRGDACRTCGAYFATGDPRCPNCGAARQSTDTSRSRDAGALPLTLRSTPQDVRPDEVANRAPAGSPSASAAGDPGRPGMGPVPTPRRPEPPSGESGALSLESTLRRPERDGRRGERLVAWSALGVLAVAAVFFVRRIDEMRDEPARDAMARSAAVAPQRSVPSGAHPSSRVAGETTTDAGGVSKSSDAGTAAGPPAGSQRTRRPPPVAIGVVRKPARGTEARAPLPPDPSAVHAEAAVPSRWALMREEIALCAPDGFFAKLICELDVRTRYCSGWWGSADECPSGRTADYGN